MQEWIHDSINEPTNEKRDKPNLPAMAMDCHSWWGIGGTYFFGVGSGDYWQPPKCQTAALQLTLSSAHYSWHILTFMRHTIICWVHSNASSVVSPRFPQTALCSSAILSYLSFQNLPWSLSFHWWLRLPFFFFPYFLFIFSFFAFLENSPFLQCKHISFLKSSLNS